MNAAPDDPTGTVSFDPEAVPEAVTAGTTILVAGSVDPSAHGVCLGILREFGQPDDVAFVVSTTESATETIARYESADAPDGPTIRLVDTTSKRQFVSALYNEVPTIFTPAPNDLERTVLGLSELSEMGTPKGGSRHVVVRSLTPLLSGTSVTDVGRVVDRIVGLRTGTGLGLFGLDFTAHDERTVTELARRVDAVVWASRTTDGSIEFELGSRPSRVR